MKVLKIKSMRIEIGYKVPTVDDYSLNTFPFRVKNRLKILKFSVK